MKGQVIGHLMAQMPKVQPLHSPQVRAVFNSQVCR